MPQVITVDVAKCMGCHSCEVACAVEHSESQNLLEAINQRPIPHPRVAVMAAGDMAVPLQCRQCEDAPCVAVCPTSALQKPDPEGPVTIDQEMCIGCKSCIIVCPFGVISLSPDAQAIIKCDMCIDRLAEGRQPACVEACPTGALQLVHIEELTAEARRRTVGELLLSRQASGTESAQQAE